MSPLIILFHLEFWGAVISGMFIMAYLFFELIKGNQDYHGFASDKPEELAQAIQKGIPATLRGMMWQHM
jgi:hypothetical protein